MKTEIESGQAGGDVDGWRRERLLESGFPPRLAASLAGDPRYDLHALIELVERGCRTDLAVRILAPPEEDDAA
jgi:hypothetical protein